MASQQTAKQSVVRARPRTGRDEMNLAEFPLSVLTNRVPDGVSSLEFSDTVIQQSTGEPITRTLRIAPSGEYGLPTAHDDEVILGLIQISKLKNNFQDREVAFTRAQLFAIIGWPQRGWSYRRLTESLNRWVGVTLYYDNAWWDSERQSWVSEKFHILDNVTDPQQPRSPVRITWNRVVFRDVQRGNLKRLDLDFYFSLASKGAQRAFRYLDKKFYRRGELTFDLREFACEHVGLSRNYHNGELKRRLNPMLQELEEKGYLTPLTSGERYRKVATGKWQIRLERAREERPIAASTGDFDVQAQLTRRGVATTVARKLAEKFPPARIREKLAVHDWLVQNRDRRIAKSPAGYLVESIRSDYDVPADYRPVADSSGSKSDERLSESSRTSLPPRVTQRQLQQKTLDEEFAALPAPEQARLELAALNQPGSILVKRYEQATSDNSRAALRRVIIRNYLNEHRSDFSVARGKP